MKTIDKVYLLREAVLAKAAYDRAMDELASALPGSLHARSIAAVRVAMLSQSDDIRAIGESQFKSLEKDIKNA